MLDYERKDFAKLLKRGALEGRRWMRSTDSEAVRIYDRNLEGVPVTVDLYGKYAKIVDYAPGAFDESTKAQVIDLVNRMAYVELGRIIYQVRRKREGLEQHTLMSDENSSSRSMGWSSWWTSPAISTPVSSWTMPSRANTSGASARG